MPTPLTIQRLIAACVLFLSPGLHAAVDLSTPQATAKSLYTAVQAQDGAAIREIFYTGDDSEKDLAASFADMLVAGKKLEDAVRTRYGGGDTPSPGMMSKDELAKIDQAKVELQGDTAQLLPAGQARPLKFKQVAGRWKLLVSDYAGATRENLPQQLETLKKMTKVLDGAAADVAAGKYPTAPEAEAGIQQKLYNVIIGAVQRTPPTNPSTAPATRP